MATKPKARVRFLVGCPDCEREKRSSPPLRLSRSDWDYLASGLIRLKWERGNETQSNLFALMEKIGNFGSIAAERGVAPAGRKRK
jgi:hypothetical protein